MHETHHFLATLALVLCAAAVTTVIFQRLKQPVVLGYLLAGMVIGPYVPIPLHADSQVVNTLAELGVILLMFSLGIEFSLQKLLHVGPTAAFVAVVQCSLMVWLGYLTGEAFGWSRLASFYAGGAIAISSTTIIVKAFEEQKLKADYTQIVFGVLIVEDLIAILLITVLTTLSAGERLSAMELGLMAGRLGLFLCALLVIGLLTVPRIMRAVVRLDRTETTVVASVGLAFGLASLAAVCGYSVALGAFMAGSLVAESGVEKTIEHLVQPVRDIFAAIFFVSVGMLIDPQQVAANWPIVLVFLGAVVIGKVVSVTLGAFLTGQSVQTSLKCGMSLAQIGEFSFIIAGVGLVSASSEEEGTYKLLYSIAVAVSGATTLLTPWLIRAAGPSAKWLDRKLPRPLQTFVALYGSWLEQVTAPDKDQHTARIRRLVRWLAVDAIVVAAIVIGASLEMARITAWTQEYLKLSAEISRWIVIGGAIALSSPFWGGMIRVAQYLGFELAQRALPSTGNGTLDMVAAPRRLLVVTLQVAIVFLVGLPLVAITQPFLPPFRGAIVLLGLVAILSFSFWRGAYGFQGHTKAAAQAIAEALSQHTRDGRAEKIGHQLEPVNRLLMGLGSPVSIQLSPNSSAVGKTLAQLNLRGLTGATVLAIRRGDDSVVVPAGNECLRSGDVLAVAGTHEAVTAAGALMGETVSVVS